VRICRGIDPTACLRLSLDGQRARAYSGYRRHSGFRRHSNQTHTSKELKHAIARANYVPVAGIAVGPIKLITLAIVENCVTNACQSALFCVPKSPLSRGGKKSKIACTHTLFFLTLTDFTTVKPV
jgi:hypothetical protein